MWRIIVIQNDSDISLNNENLIIKNMNGIFSINISEISVLIIDNIKSKISTYTMFKLSEYNICVIFMKIYKVFELFINLMFQRMFIEHCSFIQLL